MLLDSVRKFFFGDPSLPVPDIEAIPRESRMAHHHFMNVAMRMKKVANDIDDNANDLIELLARDLRRRSK